MHGFDIKVIKNFQTVINFQTDNQTVIKFFYDCFKVSNFKMKF